LFLTRFISHKLEAQSMFYVCPEEISAILYHRCMVAIDDTCLEDNDGFYQ